MTELRIKFFKKILKKSILVKKLQSSLDLKWKKFYLNETYESFFYKTLNEFQVKRDKSLIFLSGFMNYSEKISFFRLLNAFLDNNEKYDIVALEQHSGRGKYLRYTKIRRIILPKLGMNKADYDKALALSNEKEYVLNAAEILMAENNCTKEEALCIMARYYEYYADIYSKMKPEITIVWNRFLPAHEIVVNICKEKGIKVLYAENGVLPGTWVLEESGQMGASDVAVKSEEFLNKTVTDEDLSKSDEILAYLKESGDNRYTQEMFDMDERIKACKEKNKPLILFAGNYDAHAGLVPYNEEARTYHSPFFKSSNEAVSALAKIAEKNNWTVIYKPHPKAIDKAFVSRFPDSVIYIEQGNLNDLIDCVDVVATLTSQTSYISCIRGKATLLLGRNQLTGKQALYEIDSLEELESVLGDAINNGMTDSQKKMFKKHIAQIQKYYVFDDNKGRALRYGMKKEEFVKLMNTFIN